MTHGIRLIIQVLFFLGSFSSAWADTVSWVKVNCKQTAFDDHFCSGQPVYRCDVNEQNSRVQCISDKVVGIYDEYYFQNDLWGMPVGQGKLVKTQYSLANYAGTVDDPQGVSLYRSKSECAVHCVSPTTSQELKYKTCVARFAPRSWPADGPAVPSQIAVRCSEDAKSIAEKSAKNLARKICGPSGFALADTNYDYISSNEDNQGHSQCKYNGEDTICPTTTWYRHYKFRCFGN
jgi:hypothetical protein